MQWVNGVDTTAENAEIIEQHIHNAEKWFGKSADQSGNDWAEEASLTPFRAISGASDFGADANDEAKIFGTDDLPDRAGTTHFCVRHLMMSAVSVGTDSVLRFIFGVGTMAASEALGQYTDMMLTDARKGGPVGIVGHRIPSNLGVKVWIRLKNATDNAAADFFISLQEDPPQGA